MSTTPTSTLPYPLFGSDFRLREDLAQATHFADALGPLPVRNKAKILRGNLSRLVTA
jgi:hypothetical protein